MNKYIPKIPAEFVMPLDMNGLRGRMLRMPPPAGRSREFLLIYGHHASLERLYGLAEVLNEYTGVTMPDLPGFGGMDSFYKIGETPDLDTMADYLAAFIKLRYNHRKRFSIGAVSYGFIVVTRMLQRYPDIAKRVDLLVSMVGFAHYEDFTFTKRRFAFYRFVSSLFSHRLTAPILRNTFLSPAVLRRVYAKTHNAKHKFAGTSPEEREALVKFEILLWRTNDVRTHAATCTTMFTVDNCHKQVDLPVWHVYVAGDNYFDNHLVEQHMRVIFTDFHSARANLNKHAPAVIANKDASASMIPYKIRQQLNKKLK